MFHEPVNASIICIGKMIGVSVQKQISERIPINWNLRNTRGRSVTGCEGVRGL
jgi:uncharacterized membrane protein YqgA involved in biofilm formation